MLIMVMKWKFNSSTSWTSENKPLLIIQLGCTTAINHTLLNTISSFPLTLTEPKQAFCYPPNYILPCCYLADMLLWQHSPRYRYKSLGLSLYVIYTASDLLLSVCKTRRGLHLVIYILCYLLWEKGTTWDFSLCRKQWGKFEELGSSRRFSVWV